MMSVKDDAWATGAMELPFTEIGKTVEESNSGKT